ncbi:MAG: TlpA family protein disulfide reductase [Gammaproteobacteria bacterium]|jgi:peroxiredoxin|nr:TlpA family protein disulfide reductase [Gammaproteobacteria bacterium]
MLLRYKFGKLFCIVTIALLLVSNAQAGSEMKQPAPNFTLKSNSGKNIKLSELRGQVVLLNFWASWCGPCRTEMPLLVKIHDKYKGMGFTVLGVNVEEDSAPAKSIITKTKISFPVLFDQTNSVSKLYNVSAMPSTVLIDRDGNMRYLHEGYKSGDEEKYREWIKKLVQE